MQAQRIRANFLLLLCAAIWGFAFVAQRIGAKYLGSFTFNGVRFALGAISLLPLIFIFRNKKDSENKGTEVKISSIKPGLIAGCVLFAGASLQQVGLTDTTAGKAAFITGLYIVLVPIFGIFLKHRIGINIWIGVITAAVGLYFLCVTESFSIARGDLIILVGAIFWTIHILLIDKFTKKVDVIKLSFIQFITCSVLSMITALIFENITMDGLIKAAVPILYGGICSVGIAYTCQVVGQKHAQPSHAAIILSLETVFASIGGLIILNEDLGFRGYMGCALMLAGMLFSQVQFKGHRKNRSLNA